MARTASRPASSRSPSRAETRESSDMRGRTLPWPASWISPIVIQQPDRPQMTIEVPAGWEARENKRQLILTRDGRRVVVRQCTLDRAERDLRGRTGRNRVPVRGGGCLIVSRGAPKLQGPARPGQAPGVERRGPAARPRGADEDAPGTARDRDDAGDHPARAAGCDVDVGPARPLLPHDRHLRERTLRGAPPRRRAIARARRSAATAGATRCRRPRTTWPTRASSSRNSTPRRAAPRPGAVLSGTAPAAGRLDLPALGRLRPRRRGAGRA